MWNILLELGSTCELWKCCRWLLLFFIYWLGIVLFCKKISYLCRFSFLFSPFFILYKNIFQKDFFKYFFLEKKSFFSRNISVIFNRDNILWHGICLRIFDAKRVELIEGNFANWRHMFISCPHLYFHGVYIGKCTYFRPGEASFQVYILKSNLSSVATISLKIYLVFTQ